MDLFITVYPLVKLAVFIALLMLWYYLWRKEMFKTIALTALFTTFVYIYIPVRIDGTGGRIAMEHETTYQAKKYSEQSMNIPKVEAPVLSFDERMAIIDAKNVEKNKLIKEGITQ